MLNRCIICKKKLTNPESIKNGMGAKCRKKFKNKKALNLFEK